MFACDIFYSSAAIGTTMAKDSKNSLPLNLSKIIAGCHLMFAHAIHSKAPSHNSTFLLWMCLRPRQMLLLNTLSIMRIRFSSITSDLCTMGQTILTKVGAHFFAMQYSISSFRCSSIGCFTPLARIGTHFFWISCIVQFCFSLTTLLASRMMPALIASVFVKFVKRFLIMANSANHMAPSLVAMSRLSGSLCQGQKDL